MQKNWLFIVSLIFTLIGVFVFGILRQPTEMGIMIVAGAIGMAFSNIDKIQRFKGAGFEAEMKQAVEKAYATTESLKELASTLASYGIFSLAYDDRWTGMNKNTKHVLKEKIDQVCRELNIDDQITKEANDIFFWMFALDHLKRILHHASQATQDNKLMHDVEMKYNLKIGAPLPSSEEIKRDLSKLEINDSPEIVNAIKNYEHYLKHHKLRDPNAI